MRYPCAALAFASALCLTACGAESTQSPSTNTAMVARADMEVETERLNAWFETKYNESVARSPMRATFLGSRENYDKWD
ncbi:MAG: DUF885 domain-containing protein, partial [Pseudomonadota bacterium]